VAILNTYIFYKQLKVVKRGAHRFQHRAGDRECKIQNNKKEEQTVLKMGI